MDMEDLTHDLYIGNFWGMTELFLEAINISGLSFIVRCLVLERIELTLCLRTHFCGYSSFKGS
jgi:hypothetical protein